MSICRPLLLVGLMAGSLLLADGCTRSSPPATARVDREKYLRAIGACELSTYRSFSAAAGELAAATAKLEAEPTDATRSAARSAWERAMDLWQRAELMQVGPLAPSTQPGGKGLREVIYPWPLVNRCFVEQSLVAKGYEDPSFSSTALGTVRGLSAAEYLLFYEPTDNACAESSTINSAGTWRAIAPDELARRKRLFAKVITADVEKQARALVDAWEPTQGNFTASLVNAGNGSAVYATQQLAINALVDALFYLDSVTKDLKLGRPLGLSECTTGVCPERLESLWAKRSKQHVRNNLIGFRTVLTGCGSDFSTIAFDDLLTALGARDLWKRLDADAIAAIAAVDAVPFATFEEALAKDKASVRTVYDAIKKITDALRTELVDVLGLELPKRVEGDND